MIEIVKYPQQEQWQLYARRAAEVDETLRGNVARIIDDVAARGDKALIEMTERFDGCRIDSLKVSEAEIDEACVQVGEDLRSAIKRLPPTLKSSMQPNCLPRCRSR